MEVKSSEAQGRDREEPSEESVEQSRSATNRNRIRGRAGRTSGQGIAKSASIKGQNCKSGARAMTAVGLTSGDLRCVSATGLRTPQGALTAAQKSAEGVVGRVAGRRPERSPQGVEGRASRADVSWSRCDRHSNWSWTWTGPTGVKLRVGTYERSKRAWRRPRLKARRTPHISWRRSVTRTT